MTAHSASKGWMSCGDSISAHFIRRRKDDNKFVDCSIVSMADHIVSEDAHFRVLKDILFPMVRVIGLKEFQRDLFPSI